MHLGGVLRIGLDDQIAVRILLQRADDRRQLCALIGLQLAAQAFAHVERMGFSKEHTDSGPGRPERGISEKQAATCVVCAVCVVCVCVCMCVCVCHEQSGIDVGGYDR